MKFKEQLTWIVLSALALMTVLYIGPIWQGLGRLFSNLSTLIVGAVLAFMLNVPMKKVENLYGRLTWLRKSKRSLALVTVLIIFVFTILALISVVFPTLSKTFTELVSVVRTSVPRLTAYLENTGLINQNLVDKLNQYLAEFGDLSQISRFLMSVTGNVSSLFSGAFSIMMSLFFTISILSSKEHLQAIVLQLLRVCLPSHLVQRFCYIGEVIVETYDKFLMSQLLEAGIIGVLIFVSYSLCGFPYAGMAGILASVLSFIPYLGPLAACCISALFIALSNPLSGLWSIAVFQLVQVFEGNVIYPRVVGQSVGLPTLFTLSAALIGGNLFGLVGMVFFTPIFAVIYRLTKEFVAARLAQQSETEA